ncbi:hypothetical protein GGI13_003951 [Coemansia sp. RSA 455]|nr:hypothetical protein GGI14_004949 [Coemansia sp. S680]KAJ2033661.1 hypothetical protein H4S03_005499 [Coemansia sp. S3946]KAJ2046165.1 hypothetical protein H4S04_005197 [Coemansia sp. S16]KAJ2109115.1 hypothetical protein IW146_006514 [Coemansia sp. RSA 922]KAJ2250981.1 hypothetical protein GGI13_003951 [Coemansia sp. RSA 455]
MLIHPAILAVLPTLALVRAAPAPVPSLLPPYNTSAIASAIASLESLVTTVQAGLAQYGPRRTTSINKANNQTRTTTSNNLFKYCEYSGAAYKVFSDAWNCPINCQSTNTAGTVVDYHWSLKTIPSFGFVAHKDDTKEIIVSWRGSTTLMDWVADFKVVPTPWPAHIDGSAVHSGFLFAYNAGASKIKTVVAGLVQKYPDYKIVLTGHSLGGAQAALAAVDIATEHPEWTDKLELYTYGQPRVGNAAFSNWLSSQPFPIFRTVYRGDLVAQVPPMEMGFQHQAQEVWYESSAQTKFCGSDAENSTCQSSLSPLQWSVLQHLQYPGLSFDVLYVFIGNADAIGI